MGENLSKVPKAKSRVVNLCEAIMELKKIEKERKRKNNE